MATDVVGYSELMQSDEAALSLLSLKSETQLRARSDYTTDGLPIPPVIASWRSSEVQWTQSVARWRSSRS